MSSTFECVECCECPICMEELQIGKNCVTTECGHRFHTNCLMTSVAHNGFGCPYCRSVMAEEVIEDDDEEEVEIDENGIKVKNKRIHILPSQVQAKIMTKRPSIIFIVVFMILVLRFLGL